MNSTTINLKELESSLTTIYNKYYRNLKSKTRNKKGLTGLSEKFELVSKYGKKLIDELIDTSNKYLERHKINDKKTINKVENLIQEHFKSFHKILKE